MAFLFQLVIECDDNESEARRVKSHFEGHSFKSTSGKDFQFKIDEVCQDDELGRWWVSIIVHYQQRYLQITDVDDEPALLAEAGKKLYERLKSVKGYRFALSGFEIFQFNHIEALTEFLNRPSMRGLVLSEEVFQKFGQPNGFSPFSDGYRWIPANYNYSERVG
jgi:hypothetical protein